MRNVAVVLLVVSLSGTYAFGGVVSFTQTSADPVNDSILGDTMVTLDVFIDSTTFQDGFPAIDLSFGSNELQMMDLTLDPDFRTAFTGGATIDVQNPGRGDFASDIFVTGFLLGAPLVPRILVGELTVDATGASLGFQPILVSGDSVLGGTVGGSRDPLTTIGGVNVVPEPATLALLGIGGVATVLRRRRTA